ncbi:MAG: Cysteine-tRNA ligase [Candidatus Nomurabacteria bacterium GW2011_GWE1_32_28]|uniref:Cysteine--tRNA ligase n=1 Tax=Candidatus Nomurabacteria bacterium GW2011_GWF1_31_48 TaxID=1618767 RepID=A0A0G0AVM2_9BACT|nr:MAG: Cysteine-tRNA ligase [Candidatus Nomurabacteria bacterium GW2011_GWF2_30_133]KKP28942.1 MAG: Cysteine-tRNA ligase [Candidatus Nomurabacteria bacterium GW2011_GWE2_31_40]KKP30680.1 MAG: Cysteine-tRNA ligase [Candidatus Nomurabacteria bacterium GW2011_GWF1_31_48]KKP35198.1 MAG: Cysteine-tRNA ligase [Candidatus Nomurabacteria bacterium GW2011_GWE1_32_28]HAS80508.1 cysteine--tRNA ligase [Candidatus Nomurabacteria bacterium]
MSLRFYNTLTRKKEDFIPIDSKEIKMYSCGPTVYNYPHIGNYRAYIFADILKRVLLYEGFNVKQIMNITDIDDKTILNSQKEGKTLKEFTEFFTEEFFKDLKSLNLLEPSKFTKATDYIDQMVNIIKKLLEKNLAYKSTDNSIYFDIKKFKNYGKLSHLVLEKQKDNASGRIKTDEYEKDNIQDFALWKAWDKKDGDVFWKTDLGKGRPGWHIECSAMSMTNLGEQIDIHTGGVDNIFPHHENEIAQSEGATGKQFVKYWMHNEWVLVDQKKMSKSYNNFYILKDIKDKGISPISYRFWLLMANYRTRINFVWEALEGSDIALKRLYGLYIDLGNDIGKISKEYQQKFKEYIEDDLDTPRALSLLWDLVKDANLSPADKKATILDFDKVLGLDFENVKKEIIPEEIIKLSEEREEVRKNKDFKKSDELRNKINSLGYEIKDSSEGPKISKI